MRFGSERLVAIEGSCVCGYSTMYSIRELLFKQKNSMLMIFLIHEISFLLTADGNNFNVDDLHSYAVLGQ